MSKIHPNIFRPFNQGLAAANWGKYGRIRPQCSDSLAAKVFEFCHDAILITDTQFNILSVNQAFTKITGYCANEVLGRKSGFLYSNQEEALSISWIRDKIIAQGHWQGEIWGRRKNGEIYPQWLSISTATDAFRNITHFIKLFSDATEKKKQESRVEYLAYHDPLTGLPNRILFNERLSAAIALAQRHNNSLGVLFIDLDGFKQINDSLGHGAGDLVLEQVGHRLAQCVRESDAVARIGGDEFVVLLNELSSERSAEGVADKILRYLHTPIAFQDKTIPISVSIGIALFPDHGTDGIALLEKADAAMYQVKSRSKNNFKIFTDNPQIS